jgi:hydrogenase-4 component F
MPPLGVFMSEFLVVSSAFARQPWLAAPLVLGLLVAFGALLMRLIGMAFGEPSKSVGEVEASSAPLIAHLALVLVAGLFLPAYLVTWFQNVARLLG